MKGWSENKRVYKIMLVAAAILFFVLYFQDVSEIVATIIGITSPLFVGLAIAYIINIPLTKFEKLYFPKAKNKYINGSRRTVCLLLSLAVILGIAVLVIAVVIPEITVAFSVAMEGLPALLASIEEWIIANQHLLPSVADFLLEQFNEINIPNFLSSAAGYLTSGIGSLFDSSITIISTITSSVFNIFMSVTFSFFIIFAKESIMEKLKKVQQAYIKNSITKTTNYILSTLNESFHSYIIGQCTEAVILGCLCMLGMLIFRFPYAGAVGMFVGLTALIPIVGAYLGAILGGVLILLTAPEKVLFFVIFIIVLQQLEGNVIYPKVVGSSIGLPGVWVLAAVVIGGGLGGIVGMIISVPVASAAYKIMSHYTNERLKAQAIKAEPDVESKLML